MSTRRTTLTKLRQTLPYEGWQAAAAHFEVDPGADFAGEGFIGVSESLFKEWNDIQPSTEPCI